MSFNRLTMIFMNQSYVKVSFSSHLSIPDSEFQIWETGTYLMIALILVFPIVFTLQLLTNDAYFEYNEPSEAYVVRTYADLSEVYSRILVWMIISTSLNLAMNVACWYKISRYSQTSSSRQKSDYRLFLFSFVTFLIQCIAFGLGVSSSHFSPSPMNNAHSDCQQNLRRRRPDKRAVIQSDWTCAESVRKWLADSLRAYCSDCFQQAGEEMV